MVRRDLEDLVCEFLITLFRLAFVTRKLRLTRRFCVQTYRKRDPASGDETEFLENLFDILCSCLSSPLPSTSSPSTSTPSLPPPISTPHPVKTSFLENEGIELMLLLLKSTHQIAKTRALKCLAHALSGLRKGNEELSERFVECLGLKTLFAIFMGKVSPSLIPLYSF